MRLPKQSGERRDFVSRVDFLGVEVEFVHALVHPTTLRKVRGWTQAGKIDVLVKDTASGDVWVVEHKFTGESIDDTAGPYYQRLQMDPQIIHYEMGAMAAGHDVRGTVYDVVKRPSLRPYSATPPDKMKWRKPTTQEEKAWFAADPRDPRLLYANCRLRDETPVEYGQRILDDAQEKGVPHYLGLRHVEHTADDVQEYMVDVWAIAHSPVAHAVHTEGIVHSRMAPPIC